MDKYKKNCFITLFLPHLSDEGIEYFRNFIIDNLNLSNKSDRDDFIKNPVQIEMIQEIVFGDQNKEIDGD